MKEESISYYVMFLFSSFSAINVSLANYLALSEISDCAYSLLKKSCYRAYSAVRRFFLSNAINYVSNFHKFSS